MSKTPFEIRLELLGMAQAILTEQNMNSRIQTENNWNMKCEQIRFNAERKGDVLIYPEFPTIPHYTEAEVIALAEKLNTFVSKSY